MSDFWEDGLESYAEIADFENDSGLVYRPAPQIIPDIRTGFDSNGDWHVNGAALDPRVPRTLQYRMAHEIQEVIEQRASMEDYDVGLHERHEWAIDYANTLIDQNAVEESELALEALNHWRRVYGTPKR